MEKADRPMLDGSETGSKRILGSGNSLSKGGEAVWWVERLKRGEWEGGLRPPGGDGEGQGRGPRLHQPAPFSLRSCLLFPMSRARIQRASSPPASPPPQVALSDQHHAPPPHFLSWKSKRSTVWHRVSPLTPQPDALVAD